MDELKEIYGIEMSVDEKKIVALDILTGEWHKTAWVLSIASNRAQRVDALKKQEAIKYVSSLMGETE